jgi:hypothetical protein
MKPTPPSTPIHASDSHDRRRARRASRSHAAPRIGTRRAGAIGGPVWEWLFVPSVRVSNVLTSEVWGDETGSEKRNARRCSWRNVGGGLRATTDSADRHPAQLRRNPPRLLQCGGMRVSLQIVDFVRTDPHTNALRLRLPKPKVASSSLVARFVESPLHAGLSLFLSSAIQAPRVGLNRSHTVREPSETVRETVRETHVMVRETSARRKMEATIRYTRCGQKLERATVTSVTQDRAG